MSSGTPDWQEILQTESVHDNSNMGELAVRLGSPVRHFRTGQVVRFYSADDDDNTLVGNAVGTGASQTKSTNRAMTGKNSIRNITGNLVNDSNYMQFYDRVGDVSSVGLSWVQFNPSNMGEFIAFMNVVKNGNAYLGAVRYNRTTNDLQVMDSTGTYQTFTNEAQPQSAGTTQPAIYKLILNLNMLKYHGFYTNKQLHDLSNYDLRSVGFSYHGGLTSTIQIANITKTVQTVYVDDIVITVNDPI